MLKFPKLLALISLLCLFSFSAAVASAAPTERIRVRPSQVFSRIAHDGRSLSCVRVKRAFWSGRLIRPTLFERSYSREIIALDRAISRSRGLRRTRFRNQRRDLLNLRAYEVRLCGRPRLELPISSVSTSSAAQNSSGSVENPVGISSSATSSSSSVSSSVSSETSSYESRTSVTQWGVTFHFDGSYRVGQFVNGDFWVVPNETGGAVNITRIEPDATGLNHGWEVNPASPIAQGFDTRIGSYNATLTPALPYAAQPGQSLVKSISRAPLTDTSLRPILQTAAVLTVLNTPPPLDALRPAYFGNNKHLYRVSQLHLERLPALVAPPGSVPTLASVADDFRRVQLDHKTDWVGRAMHPLENMPDYGSQIATRNAEGALRLMLQAPIEQKLPALVNYLQYGIDLYHTMILGGGWPANGGHSEGRKLPIVFASVLFDDAEMQQAVRTAINGKFGENGGVYRSSVTGEVLYGQNLASESAYWTNITVDTDSRTQADPYQLIDGGYRPGSSYQFCCLSMPWKANAIAVRLLPGAQNVWNDDDFLAYVDRWVSTGATTQPDYCAPADGICIGGPSAGQRCTTANEQTACGAGGACGFGQCESTSPYAGQACAPDAGPGGTASPCGAASGRNYSCRRNSNYGVTYGPAAGGGCIRDTDPSDGIGRFPTLDQSSVDSGYYGSSFANAMWALYR